MKFNCVTGTQPSVCSRGSSGYILAIIISINVIYQTNIGDYFSNSCQLITQYSHFTFHSQIFFHDIINFVAEESEALQTICQQLCIKIITKS